MQKKAFMNELKTTFEADADFVDDIGELFEKYAGQVTKTPHNSYESNSSSEEEVPQKKPQKAPRKVSPYNFFVKAKMKDEAIKAIPHKLKMTETGKLWRELSPEEKQEYARDFPL